MKKLLILLLLCSSQHYIYSQPDLVVQRKIDSILDKAAIEKDTYKRLGHLIGLFASRIEEYPYLVMHSHQRVYAISQKDNDKVSEAFAWALAGHSYRLSGNYIKGLEYHHKAVAMAEETGNQTVLSFTQTVMGHLYKDREEYRKAIKLYLAANKIEPVGQNEKILKHWLNGNLSNVYLSTRQLDSCLFYAKQAERTNKPGAPSFLADWSTAGAYSLMGRSAESEKIYHRGIKRFRLRGSNRMLTISYLALAEHFQRQRMHDSAVFYARESIKVIHNTGYHYLAMKPAKLMTDLYYEKNADSTLKYLKIYRAANDSLYSTQANQQLQMMTFEEDLRQRNVAAGKIEYENRIRTNLLLVGLGMLFLIGMILFYNNRQKQKTNKELQTALTDLKMTQSQLIQSEKMASLGELTAGIAHEIQNPLNFVNNFSEVSIELLDEIAVESRKPKAERDDKIISEIHQDIKLNLEKISHHGKRADSIVKGMLQHSQATSGQKEPTDINALADEYLRLAYHGLRAKDKSFNAELITNFDENLPKINVIPQDIGRVLLNLFNNAFHATQERRKSEGENYIPLIEVSSSVHGNSIEIRVKDNGYGIPDNIKEKIFQPFFTTKPTGEGTGLGLSLAYDIVKAHGGELSVDSTEKVGSVFLIQLPKN